jgi:ABC-2 type transport system ATP-binding protein
MGQQGRRIEVSGLTKTFGDVKAVDDLSFVVEPGSITGFLGPNGAGKTTTLRMLLGLVRPDSGTATVDGQRFAQLAKPTDAVGAVLDASGCHPHRSGRGHLRIYCTANGYPQGRADEVLALSGLTEAGRRKVGGYSLGMRQRLALATALLGDPAVLVLDEPANGLDPEGILWMRRLLREFAEQGRTVLVSSHVLSEMQQLVDRVVIINKGRLISQGTLTEVSGSQEVVVSVRTPHADELCDALAASVVEGLRIDRTGPDSVRVTGMGAADIGRHASAKHIEIHELATERRTLEQVFFALTAE